MIHRVPSDPSWRILVAEDEPTVAGTMERALRSQGHEVTVVTDGSNALHHARADLPDLILLDVDYGPAPGRDGFQVLTELRRDPLTKNIAVIIVSGVRGEAHIVAGLQLADDYVTKPFSIAELVARVNAVMRRASNNTHVHSF